MKHLLDSKSTNPPQNTLNGSESLSPRSKNSKRPWEVDNFEISKFQELEISINGVSRVHASSIHIKNRELGYLDLKNFETQFREFESAGHPSRIPIGVDVHG